MATGAARPLCAGRAEYGEMKRNQGVVAQQPPNDAGRRWPRAPPARHNQREYCDPTKHRPSGRHPSATVPPISNDKTKAGAATRASPVPASTIAENARIRRITGGLQSGRPILSPQCRLMRPRKPHAFRDSAFNRNLRKVTILCIWSLGRVTPVDLVASATHHSGP